MKDGQRPQGSPAHVRIRVEDRPVDQRQERALVLQVSQDVDHFPARQKIGMLDPLQQIGNHLGTQSQNLLPGFFANLRVLRFQIREDSLRLWIDLGPRFIGCGVRNRPASARNRSDRLSARRQARADDQRGHNEERAMDQTKRQVSSRCPNRCLRH